MRVQVLPPHPHSRVRKQRGHSMRSCVRQMTCRHWHCESTQFAGRVYYENQQCVARPSRPTATRARSTRTKLTARVSIMTGFAPVTSTEDPHILTDEDRLAGLWGTMVVVRQEKRRADSCTRYTDRGTYT